MHAEDIVAEVKRGEGSMLEFKSTLRWNIRAQKDDNETTLAVLKTIAGFLNTSGGVVLIGVTDAGSIRGISEDHFKNEDQFTLVLYGFIKTAMGPESAAHVRAACYLVDDVSVCRVDCDGSPQPVFLTFASEKDAFFIRTGPMTTKLPPSKIHVYVKERWSEKAPVPRPRVTLQYVPPTETKYGLFVFRNDGDVAAHNIRADIEVSDTKWGIRFGNIDVLESGASIEAVPSTSYEGRPILKERFEGDFRLLMKGIYVRRVEELRDSHGGEADVVRTYLRQSSSVVSSGPITLVGYLDRFRREGRSSNR